jgi:hypothetical protein
LPLIGEIRRLSDQLLNSGQLVRMKARLSAEGLALGVEEVIATEPH